jgi:hypothetical protein
VRVVTRAAGLVVLASLSALPAMFGQASSPLPTDAKVASEGAGQDDNAAYRERLRRLGSGVQEKSATRGDARTTTMRNFVKHVAFDQLHIWESPFKLRDTDATWAMPLGILTGSLIDTDRDLSRHAAAPSRRSISKQISDAGLYASIGAGAGFFALGAMTHNDHARETGMLSGEAFVNATLVAEALKYAVGRQRPLEGDGFGHIGRGGSSFPSEHAIGTWAIASVVAHEYPGFLMQAAAYGTAAAVSATRVTAGEHFPSDVLVGGTFGYLIGRKIYQDHHNADLPGADYGEFVHERKRDAAHSGSAYVPLDSWVYPVIDRLSGLGYIHSNFDSERPWTRLECERLTAEAEETSLDRGSEPDVDEMISALQKEFVAEKEVWDGNSDNRSAEIESIYTRVTQIAGPPLRDGYHFGQTIYNDFGRPYGQGFNNVTGFSTRATSGPVVLYFRGEYQHAPGTPDYSGQIRQAEAAMDAFPGNPPLPVMPAASDLSTNRFRMLEAYVAVKLRGVELSVGNESLWWSPAYGSAMLLTDNAEPIPMMRATNTSPVRLPGIAGLLGPIHLETFVGRLAGHRFVAQGAAFDEYVFRSFFSSLSSQPFLNGQKLTFAPTENFQFSVSRTGVIGGSGVPVTAKSILNSFANLSSGSEFQVGDRRSGVDATYRMPGLRNRLLLYVDAFTDDDVSPLNYPRRAPMYSGLYISRLPILAKADFRFEGGYTDIPDQDLKGFFYWNRHYLNGYTNGGNLMGSWLGRDSRGVALWSTYWASPHKTLQVNYRHQAVNAGFLTGGGVINDFGVAAVQAFGRFSEFRERIQVELLRYPLLFSTRQANTLMSIEMTLFPQHGHEK